MHRVRYDTSNRVRYDCGSVSEGHKYHVLFLIARRRRAAQLVGL
jgi:hypothetical protein